MNQNTIVLLFCLIVIGFGQIVIDLQADSKPKVTYQSKSMFTVLNQKLQRLDDAYILEFMQYYTHQKVISLSSKSSIGEYLFLLGKMYLYDILPESDKLRTQSRYALAYHYLKTAAQSYENSQAYYYLAVLQYLKIVPTITLQKNLENQSTGSSATIQQQQLQQAYIEDIKNRHLHNIQHNLYLASLLGHNQAALSLAFMFKQGIATSKNCTSALAYYLMVMKNTRVGLFELPSQYQDLHNFQEELYRRHKITPFKKSSSTTDIFSSSQILGDNLGNYDISTIESMAFNYLYGNNGYLIDHEKAFKLFQAIKDDSSTANLFIRFMYIQGKGTQINTQLARDMFIADPSPISQQLFLGIKYFGIGMENQFKEFRSQQRKQAIWDMQSLFDKYLVQKGAIEESETTSEQQNSKVIQTQLIKYLIGTLVLSKEIVGQKDEGIYLIQSAAKAGNTLAISHMGLIFTDASDLSFDCLKAINHLSSQTYSHQFFQSKLPLAKHAIKSNKIMFALIKYTQLMLVGYKNSFINSYYLLQVYGKQIYNFNDQSWSVKNAYQNKHYQFLLKQQFIQNIRQSLIKEYNPQNQNILNKKNIGSFLICGQKVANQYLLYAKMKVMAIGIRLHKLSALNMVKYRKNKDIYLLHNIANAPEKGLHIYQARYLLGKYYQNTNISNTQEQQKLARAHKEYFRATKDELLSTLLFTLGANKIEQMFDWSIVHHLSIYMTIVVLIWVYSFYKRSKKLQNILKANTQINTNIKVSFDNQEQTHNIGINLKEKVQQQVESNISERKEDTMVSSVNYTKEDNSVLQNMEKIKAQSYIENIEDEKQKQIDNMQQQQLTQFSKNKDDTNSDIKKQ